MRQTQVISFSLPEQQARELKKSVREAGISLSEFLRKALAGQLRLRQWKRLRQQGNQTAKQYQISPEDIEAIVDEFRE